MSRELVGANDDDDDAGGSASTPPSSLPLGIGLAHVGAESPAQQSWEWSLVGDTTSERQCLCPVPSTHVKSHFTDEKIGAGQSHKGRGTGIGICFPVTPLVFQPCPLSLVTSGTMTHSGPLHLQPDLASRAF